MSEVSGQAPSDAPVITIDGPSGSGKGTISQLLATTLRWHFLDSGALYRLVAVAAGDTEVAVEDTRGLVRIAEDMEITFAPSASLEAVVTLAGRDVSHAIRQEAAGVLASQLAAIPEVRSALLARQRGFAVSPGLVADGRDMGTVVFPAAQLKIFLTASADERAQRRCKQLKDKGESVNLHDILEAIRARDERDSQRAVAPLAPAADAVLVDSSGMTIDDVHNAILAHARARGLMS